MFRRTHPAVWCSNQMLHNLPLRRVVFFWFDFAVSTKICTQQEALIVYKGQHPFKCFFKCALIFPYKDSLHTVHCQLYVFFPSKNGANKTLVTKDASCQCCLGNRSRASWWKKRVAYHVIGDEHFAQQLRHGALSLHGGVGLAQVHSHPQWPLAVHKPGRHCEDALLHVCCRGQAAELLEGNHGILGKQHEKSMCTKDLNL